MSLVEEPETEEYLRQLNESTPLRNRAEREVVKALDLPAGSRGLDVGCGNGAQAMLLAEAVGLSGHVTGLDISVEFLEYGRGLLRKAGLVERVKLLEGDMNSLPFKAGTFDWAFSINCVGYGPGDPMPALREMERVVRPGGTVALCMWSSEKLLPGHPELEARLQATAVGMAPYVRGGEPGTHCTRTLAKLHALELEGCTVRTIAGDAYAPLSQEMRTALTGMFEMRWPGVEKEINAEDWSDLKRLIAPDSQDFILDEPDYYGFFTYSLFSGKIPS